MKNSRAILTLVALLLCYTTAYTQTANFLWVQQAGGTDSDGGRGIATDGSGNSFVTGRFNGIVTFGDTTLTSAGCGDIFIAKYDGSGNLLWTKQAGSEGCDFGADIATDSSGNWLVTGFINEIAIFDDTTVTPNAGKIFLAKYDGSGNLLWLQQGGGNGDISSGNDIVTDGSGNWLVTGEVQGTVTFGDTTLPGLGGVDIFIAKYDGNGNFLWLQLAGGSSEDQGFGIATDSSDNSLVTGRFKGTATFSDTTLRSTGSWDMFVAKYDGSGNLLWARQAGGTNFALGAGIATDDSGHSLVIGIFNLTATFGDTTLTSVGGNDIFIAKYDANGNLLWVQQAGGPDSDFGSDITIDDSGNCLITGSFLATATFGDTTLTSAGAADIFIAKYDGSGNLLWARQAGGTESDTGWDIAKDGSGNLLVTGDFQETADFDPTTLTSAGGTDIFVAKVEKGAITGIAETFTSFMSFSLLQNYPNPFNPTTVIDYQLSAVSDVELTIYNQLGQRVKTLVNKIQHVGTYQIEWDGKDGLGRLVSSGVYLYRLKAGAFVQTRKMVLLQ
jgi:hypothetical protein